MRYFGMLLVGLAFGLAAAQAPATPGSASTDLLFNLLGTANTINIEVPAAAQHLYLAAVLDGETILAHDRSLTERRGQTLTATVTAGALSNANGCPLLLFFHSGLADASGREFATGTSSYCRERTNDIAVRRAHMPSPLLLSRARELPLDTWLALEAVQSEPTTSWNETGSLEGMIVFYLHLSTSKETSPPEAPAFMTSAEIAAASQASSE